MRVLLLNQVFHPDPQATSQYLSRLAIELVQQGHEVTVLSGRRAYNDPSRSYSSTETWNGVEIIRVWNTGFGNKKTWCRMLDFLSFLVSAVLRGLFLRRADVVVALTTPPLVSVLGGILSTLWQARFIYWVMDLNPDEVVAAGMLKADAPITRFLEATSRWSLKRANRIMVPDIYMRERIVAKGIEPEKIDVIPLWAQGELSYDEAGRERFRRAHGLESKYVVMYAGNHTPCNPLDTLVEAMRLLQDEPGVHFCFIGDGTERTHLIDLARKGNWENVTFLDYQPFTELSGLLSAADVQVVVMGDPFVGIIHPCKVYNFLATERRFIYIGPERSHIVDLIREAKLEEVATSYRHGDGAALAGDLRLKVRTASGSNVKTAGTWPATKCYELWTEPGVLKRIVSVITK